jgi:DNA-directed RNA polymerase specialized sigma24 family protein
VHSTNRADPRETVLQRLAAVREDPRIEGFALRHAGHPHLAEDALQTAYCAVAQLEHPEQIENLRAYFCTVLIREVRRARGQLGAALVEDFDRVAEAHQNASGDRCHPAPPPATDELACRSAQGQIWLGRFAAQRDVLQAAVPARSDDPDRYRSVVTATAEHVLRDCSNGEQGDADSNDAFQAAFPEYFDEPGAPLNTLHQRFSRARADVRALLQGAVNRDELS